MRRFLTVIQTLFTQRRATVIAPGESIPDSKSGIDFLGWFDVDWLYLIPEATFAAVFRFCRETGEHFPIRQDRLKKDLVQAGISKCHAGHLTTIKRVGDHSYRVLQLSLEKVEEISGVTGVTTRNRFQVEDEERDGL